MAQEVDTLNGALTLLGNANHNNNLARRFVIKREINQRYSNLCSDRVPMTRFFFGDDVSLSAKHTKESENLKHKIAAKKPSTLWRNTGGRTRDFWAKASHKGFSSRFQPYELHKSVSSSNQRPTSAPEDTNSKNAKSQAHYRPQQ